jgi:hypothetical protein
LGPGKRGWHSPEGNWRKTLAPFIRQTEYTRDLYTRVIPPAGDNRLIIETPSKHHSRGILKAIRAHKGTISATMHLTPQEKANKALVYRKCDKKLTKIEDIGNVVIVTSRLDGHIREAIEVS